MGHAEAMDSQVHELVTVFSTILTIACKCCSAQNQNETRSSTQQQRNAMLFDFFDVVSFLFLFRFA